MDTFAPTLSGNILLKDVLEVEGSFLVLYLIKQAIKSGIKVGLLESRLSKSILHRP